MRGITTISLTREVKMDAASGISDVDLVDVPLRALRPNTRALLSSLLNPAKVIPSEDGLPRDWRGLYQLSGLSGTIPCNSPDPTAQILCMWEKFEPSEDGLKPSLGLLQIFLGQLDRWDAVDDTKEMMRKDAEEYSSRSKQVCPLVPELNKETDSQILTRDDVSRFKLGLPAQNYDAFLLYAEEDEVFASEMLEKLENDYGLKLCCKDRDLIGGLTFEHEAIMRIIADRCNRLIIILSPNFLRSDANKFFVTFAQALGIEQRQRKVVPCLYQSCELPPHLIYYFLLDYNRSSQLWNFWEKLRDSVQTSSPSVQGTRRPALPQAPHINRCTVEEVQDEEEAHPAETSCHGETALVCLSDPATLYPSGTSSKKKSSDQCVPNSSAIPQNHEQGLQVLTTEPLKPKSPTNFLRRLLPKELSPAITPVDSSKPKNKWFTKKKKKKAVALETA